jgi:hypothetical protein
VTWRRVVGIVLGAVIIQVFIAIAVNAATNTEFPGPLRLIQRYPWQAVLLAVAAAAAYTVWEVRSRHGGGSPSAAQLTRARARLVADTGRIWVDGVLAHSLGEIVRIDLTVIADPDRVTHPANLLIRVPDRADEPIPAGAAPIDVFVRCGERLLVLGAPGAGKTTMLLELARDLRDRAMADATAPVPVVLSLSSWPADARVSLKDWVTSEVRRFHDVSREQTAELIKQGGLALLLDGLDEVPAGRLAGCVHAINVFRDVHGTTPIAITSRLADYELAVTALRLTGAVVIQPLTEDQADDWLRRFGEPLDALRAAMRDDADLRDLLRTPLTLSIAALAYQGQAVAETTGLDGLFAEYTRRMLNRSPVLAEPTGFAEPEARRWLGAVARMTTGDAMEADLSQLRGRWPLERFSSWPRLIVALMTRGALPMAVLAGAITLWFAPWQAVPAVVAFALAAGWVRAYPPVWFFAGMTSYSGDDRTYWEEGRRGTTGVLAAVAAIAFNVLPCVMLFDGLLDAAGDSVVGRVLLGAFGVVGSICAVVFWVSFAVAGLAFVPDELFDWLRERGTRLGAAPYAVVAVLVAGTVAGAAGSICGIALNVVATTPLDPVPMSTFYWWFGAGPVAFVAGKIVLAAQFAVSDACTGGVVYRLLARNGELPPLPGKFLAWADGRILLRRTGDRYVFLHRLYRDWWAAQP